MVGMSLEKIYPGYLRIDVNDFGIYGGINIRASVYTV